LTNADSNTSSGHATAEVKGTNLQQNRGRSILSITQIAVKTRVHVENTNSKEEKRTGIPKDERKTLRYNQHCLRVPTIDRRKTQRLETTNGIHSIVHVLLFFTLV
jgi:hypothetical protein